MLDLECENLGQEVERHLGYLHGVLGTVRHRHPARHHIRVPDSLNLVCLALLVMDILFSEARISDLVNIVVINTVVKQVVEIIEKVDDLVCGAVRGDGGEADYVAEEHCAVVADLWLGDVSSLHLLDDRPWQQRTKQLLSLLLLVVISVNLDSNSLIFQIILDILFRN